jgi:very-short-patch-repair endonuclease
VLTIHYTGNGEDYDEERTKYLNSLNIIVIRFENKEVFQAIEYVLGRIYSCFNHP